MKNTYNLNHNGVKGIASHIGNTFTVYVIGFRDNWSILGEYKTLAQAIENFNAFANN